MKNIAVFFGGVSTEHDVSIVTALSSVIKPLELTKKYNVVPIYIAKDGRWYTDESLKNIETFQSAKISKILIDQKQLRIQVGKGLIVIKPMPLGKKNIETSIDIAFPAMHGTHGEDGELMGVFELAGIPYVGCGVQASAIAMDKVSSKQITESHGISNTPWEWFMSDNLAENKQDITKRIKRLHYPLFVKPAHLGSSIGITKVDQYEELYDALEVAAHYDTKVIVEQAVQNLIEVTLPIMGNVEPVPALLESPLLEGDDNFFDFSAKYLSESGKKGGKNSANGAQGYSQLPAKLPKQLYEKAVNVGLASYRAVGCEGIARVDMLIDSKTNEVFFNEINPLPGSLYAHNWRQVGVSSIDLVVKLVEYAEERHKLISQKASVFSTSFLENTKI